MMHLLKETKHNIIQHLRGQQQCNDITANSLLITLIGT